MVLALIDLTLGQTVFPRLSVGWSSQMDWVAGGTALVSLGVFLYTRSSMRDPASFITLGLVYEVALAAALGFLNHSFVLPPAMATTPALSRVAFIMLIFAAVVPSTPRRTLVAALIAASMDPLAMAGAIATGRLQVASSSIFWMHLPNYLTVGVAVVVSHIITRLGRHVRDARELGSYRLGELLGRGGMGEVYVAHHRMLARPAAIKLIRPEKLEFDGTEHAQRVVQRFKREAEAAASLRSPHTIELYDFGETDDGTLYFVMELLDGIDLESLVDRFGPMPPARAVHALRQVCASLAEAHAQGLVHRDIKPANIHLCRMGLEHDVVKVLDFGIVKSRRPTAKEHGVATVADRIIGTPAFMPPEMAAGEAVDGRTDLYGVGCVVLAADGAARVRWRDGLPDRGAAYEHCPTAAFPPQSPRDSCDARQPHPFLPRERPRAAAARCAGALTPSCRVRGRRAVDGRAGREVVADAPSAQRSAGGWRGHRRRRHAVLGFEQVLGRHVIAQ
jgi:serine/threonine-protein kinase